MNLSSVSSPVTPRLAPVAAPAVEPAPGELAASVGPTLVGQGIEDARAAAAQLGLEVRVSTEDGVGCVLTMDYDTNRINVGTKDDIVTDFEGVG